MTALRSAARRSQADGIPAGLAASIHIAGGSAGGSRSQPAWRRRAARTAGEVEAPDARSSFEPVAVAVAPPARRDADRLVRDHLRLVRKHAWQIYTRMSSAIELDDLIQIGTVALVELAQRFEDRGTVAFSTLAVVRVRGAMVDALRLSAPLSRGAMRRTREIAAARQTLQRELGRTPTSAEIAARLGLTPAAYSAAVQANEPIHYEALDALYSDADAAFADPSPDAFSTLDEVRLKRSIHDAIASLPSREALIVNQYFGEDRQLHEIGRDLNLSTVRVHQLKTAALNRMRPHLAAWDA